MRPDRSFIYPTMPHFFCLLLFSSLSYASSDFALFPNSSYSISSSFLLSAVLTYL